MVTQEPKSINFLYLDRITLRGVPNSKYGLELFVGNKKIELRREHNHIWAPAQRLDVSLKSQMRAEIQMARGHLWWVKKGQTSNEVNLQRPFNDYWTSEVHDLTVSEDFVIGKHHCSLELEFSTEATAESLRSQLRELERLLQSYLPVMSGSKEKALDKVIQYGVALSELNPFTKAAFSVVKVSFELLREQNKHDQILSRLFDRLDRIMFFARKTAEEIVCEETEILEKTIPRMFEVMQRVAKFSCDYVKCGRLARAVDGLVDPDGTIEEMDRELAEVVEDFDRAVNVEVLHRAKVTEQMLLLGRLEPIKTGYELDRRCMEGTRQSILSKIMAWVSNPQETNTYWFYGSPGIGKTSLAHSICEKLHERKHLAGAFFCRRDDPNLSETRNVLPTLINKLAEIFPSFRSIVAERLRKDPNLTSKSMKHSLFLDFICNVPRQPKHALVFVVDALDECGDDQSRPGVLKALADAAAQAPWLKIIITSRPEVDIQQFFETLAQPSYSPNDLAADQEASKDLRKFARSEFNSLASKWHLPKGWPEDPDFNRVISRANGLFIFIKTLVLALRRCADPEEYLRETLQRPAGTGLESLYGLYSSILKARIVDSNAKFQRVIGVLVTTTPYSALCEETIAGLAGVKPNLVKKWVDDLSSLLYRDERANGGIRVWHLSIYNFFVDIQGDYQVNLQDTNIQLGIICLKMMLDELRFNICKLEDSRFANAYFEDLQNRIKDNIPGPLRYSSRYWSNHLCFTPDNRNQQVWKCLKDFFEGLYPLFWIEVLSIMGIVPVGAPSLRRLVSWIKDSDSDLLGRIQDVYRFIITFHHPISISAPHTYISTLPFLPLQSPLSTTSSTKFSNAINLIRGKLLSWPAPPLEWIGHTSGVNCMSYSPNGCHIVTGSDDKTIRVWDAETGAVVGEPLKGHTGCVLSVAYSPDGQHIISGSGDWTIRIWDAETGVAVDRPIEGHTDFVRSVAYSPDGRRMISGSDDRTIRMWDGETHAAVGDPLQGHTGCVWSIACSADGRHIISGSDDNTIRIWDVSIDVPIARTLEGHTGSVLSVAYSPDGRRIISGSSDMTIQVWDTETGDVVGKPLKPHTKHVRSVAYSPNGSHIVSGSDDGTIRMWDAKTFAAVGEPLKGHTDHVWSVAYSPDGRYIISGSSDRAIRMWDGETGVPVGTSLEGHTDFVRSVTYSPDGRRIISGSGDRTLRIWDAKTGAAIGKPLAGHTDCVSSIACSPDGQYIISGSGDRTIRMWDAKTGAAIGKPLEGHTNHVRFVSYSPDGRHIVSAASDKTIRRWDAKNGTPIGEPLEGHTRVVNFVAYSPDGQHIISGGGDSCIRIWDAKTGAAVGKPLEGHTDYVRSIAYSPDEQHIISGSDDATIRMWDAKTGAAVGDPRKGHDDYVWSVAYSRDGRHIISASSDKTIRIWDAKTSASAGDSLEGHTEYVRFVAYSPDGEHIVSGSGDRTIRIWNAEPGVTVSEPVEGRTSRLYSQPDADGWVRDSEGRLLYWVPTDCRAGLHSPAILTIPPQSPIRSVSLDFKNFAFGTSWTRIFNSAQP